MPTIRPRQRLFTLTWGTFFFVLLHLVSLLGFVFGVDWIAFGMFLTSFLIRKFGITGGFHRYFSHRSYKTSRFFQFILAFIGGMAAQRGALWWAAHHRHHHKHSDTKEDIHSVKQDGFYWSHLGWILSQEYNEFDPQTVRDLTRYPELVWLNKYNLLPPALLALSCYLLYGGLGFLWGCVISTVVLYHTTFSINSLCHMLGRRRFETGEGSRNSFILAIFTMGEGWHNNHHHYPLATRHGFRWWEIDFTYYILKVLSYFSIVWNFQRLPATKFFESRVVS